jgi:signal transduction histidine kinase
MLSLRTKLTAQYSIVALATTLVFGLAVYVSLRATTTSDLEKRAEIRGDAAWRLLRRLLLSGGSTITGDSVSGVQRIGISPATRDLLDILNGPYLMLKRLPPPNSLGLVYASPSVRPDWDQQDTTLTAGLQALQGGQHSVAWDSKHLLLVQRAIHDPDFGDLLIVTGADRSPIDVLPLEVLGAALIVLPIILGISVGGAYVISGHATSTVASIDRITTEVAAITDGRSLHRRLPTDTDNAELRRLTTQLNSMIERLQTSFGALRRFTADASHELKTPLTVLRADVERAMHAPAHSNEQLVALEEALQETTRMADLVESLLTLARFDEGRFDLHREPVDMEPLAREVLETALILGEDAGVHVTMPVIDDAVVQGDRKRLRQLFLNLVTNALKYTPRGGEVELSLSRTVSDVVFAVRDTGIGISAADLPHVFERFWRADRARSRVGERGGFGLGLAIGQWIAQAHGGTLTVDSRLHRGSTFTVTLPRDSGEVASVGDREGEEFRAAS